MAHVNFNQAQAVALGQALGGGAWRVCGGGETIPAPDIALAGHQALAGEQLRLQGLTHGLGDHADMRQAPLQGRGGHHEFGQGFSTLWQA